MFTIIPMAALPGPAMMDGRTMTCAKPLRPHRLFGLPLGPMVAGGARVAARAEGAHVHEQPDARLAGGVEQGLGAADVDGLEGLRPRLDDDAHQVDNRVRPVHEGRERRPIAQVAGDQLDAEVPQPFGSAPADGPAPGPRGRGAGASRRTSLPT